MRRARKGPAWAVSLVAVGLLMVMGLAVRVRLGSDWTSLLPDGHAYVTTAWQWFFEPAASSPNQLTAAKPTIPPLMREQSPGSCRPPGYPLFLAAVTRGPIEGPPSFFIPVKKWQLGLDLLTCVWVLLLARRLHGGAAGGIGLALALFCPTLVLFTAAILTETLATFLLTSLAGLLLWAGAAKVAWHRLLLMALAGLVAAASALVRPDGLLCGLYLLALPLLWSEQALGARLRLIACAVVPFVLLLSLWPLRNWVRFGRPHLYAELCDIRNQPLERTAVFTGSDAKNNPVARQFVQPELNNTELPKRTLDALTDDPDADRGEILIADASSLASDYAAALAFNEEPVTILLHRGREKNAPTHEHVSVNGQTIWIPVDQPTRIARKFVEVLARAQPMNVSTDSGESPGDQITFNNVNRSLSSLCSFSVLEDKNPRGREWLTRVMREG